MSECILEKCAICGSIKNLQVHHISYEPEETITVCKECHINLHGRKHGTGNGKGWSPKWKDQQTKQRFIKLWRLKTYDELMRVFNISYMTVYNWSRQLGLENKIPRGGGVARSIYFSEDVYARLAYLSVRKNKKMKDLIVEAVEKYLEEEMKEGEE